MADVIVRTDSLHRSRRSNPGVQRQQSDERKVDPGLGAGPPQEIRSELDTGRCADGHLLQIVTLSKLTILACPDRRAT